MPKSSPRIATQPAASSPHATDPSPAARAYPKVHVERYDLNADELSTTGFDIHPDGAFTIEHVMSDGGSEHTVTACSGRIPAAEASAWVERIQRNATLPSPPRGPDRNEAFERRIAYAYDVVFAAEPKHSAYADPERLIPELEPLLERLLALAHCQ